MKKFLLHKVKDYNVKLIIKQQKT